MTRFGTEILRSEFPDDDGSAPAALLAALRWHAMHKSAMSAAAVMTELADSRLLVPVISRVDVRDERGADKDSHIASVIFESRDGRRGLPAFTSVEALKQWQKDARPIAQHAHLVAASALDQGCDGLLLDMASDHRWAVTGEALKRLARRQ